MSRFRPSSLHAAAAAAAALLLAAAPAPARADSRTISSPQLTVGLGFDASGRALLTNFSFFGAGAMTANFARAGTGAEGGGTLLLPASAGRNGRGAATAACGTGGCSLQSTPTSVTLAGLSAGGATAAETWSLQLLNASAFSFSVARVWAAGAVDLIADRFAFSFSTTGGLPIHSEQIPGFVDLDMFLNDTSTGGFDIGNSAFEFLSPNARQFLRFTPTGALFVVEGSATLGGAPLPALFSFAKPFADGTTWCSVGYETIDPRSGAPRAAPAPGTAQTLTVTFHLVETDIPVDGQGLGPFPLMDVALPNTTLQAQMAQLLGAQYQLLGWVMGNNPASTPCLHEMAWWPMMASVFPASSVVAVKAMQKELSFFAGCGYAPYAWLSNPGVYQNTHSCNASDGAKFGMMQRYSSEGFYNCPQVPTDHHHHHHPHPHPHSTHTKPTPTPTPTHPTHPPNPPNPIHSHPFAL